MSLSSSNVLKIMALFRSVAIPLADALGNPVMMLDESRFRYCVSQVIGAEFSKINDSKAKDVFQRLFRVFDKNCEC